MSTKYCDMSDLPVEFCAHCKGHVLDPDLREEADEVDKTRGRNAFPAVFPGKCADCGEKFPKDTLITGYGKGKYAHAVCEED